MKGLLLLSCLFGMSRALGGGGCPLNYGDSCGWEESADGTLCYKSHYHGKSLYDAADLCWALGTYECPSELMYADEAPLIIEEADPMDLPQMVRVNAKSFCRDCEWQNIVRGMPYFPGPPFTPTMYEPYDLPSEYEDHHIISAVWEVGSNMMTGHTPSEDRVSFVCTSCVTVEYACPIICEFCIPSPPMDGMWSGWESWGACTGTCMYGAQERHRYCSMPEWDGDDCFGDDMQSRGCETSLTSPCDVDGEWGPWDSWTACGSYLGDAGCGDGLRTRDRLCNDPAPFNGANCKGSGTDYDYSCDMGRAACVSVDTTNGEWCSWEQWTPCDADCGLGMSYKRRACECPPQGNAGSPCTDFYNEGDEEERWCKAEACPLKSGEWTSWSSWFGECAMVCGPSEDVRSRDCVAGDGSLTSGCLGERRQTKPCADQDACSTDLAVAIVGTLDYNDGSPYNYNGIEDIDNAPSGMDRCSFTLPYNIENGFGFKFGRAPVFCGGTNNTYFDDNWGDPDLDEFLHAGCVIGRDVNVGTGVPMDAYWQLGPTLTTPRAHAAVAQLTEYSIMVIGGGPNKDVGCTTEFLFADDYDDFDSLEFVPGPVVPGLESLSGACAVALDANTVVVTGGRVDGFPSFMNIKYDLCEDEWTELPNMLVKHENHHCALFDRDNGQEIVVAMGDTGTKSLEIYNVESMEWRLGDSCPKAFHSSFSYNIPERGLLYVAGGYDVGEYPGNSAYLSNLKRFIYDYDADSWSLSYIGDFNYAWVHAAAVVVDWELGYDTCTHTYLA